jgi:hypothetical protein
MIVLQEVADPLMDVKLACEELETCATFQWVMAMLLAVGNFLNGGDIKGFQLDYLSKVPEVKDTSQHKHSLVYHLCQLVMDKYPTSTDLYSELGAVARCAKVDFDEVAQTLDRLERDCRSSWDYLRVIGANESESVRRKIGDFLSDCVERILTLKTIHRRIINRFHHFLLYMGMSVAAAKEAKVNTICKTVTEFALEYRNSRERLTQTRKRQAEKRERNKTRGKMWVGGPEVTGLPTTTPAINGVDRVHEQRHDELSRALLNSTAEGQDWRRQRLKPAADRNQQLLQDRNGMLL